MRRADTFNAVPFFQALGVDVDVVVDALVGLPRTGQPLVRFGTHNLRGGGS